MKSKKWHRTALSVCTLFTAAALFGQPAGNEVISLPSKANQPGMVWEGGERTQVNPQNGMRRVSNVSQPTLTVFLPEPSKATGTGLIIAPGGGFHLLSIDNEGNDVAAWCTEHGIAAFVLRYRLVPTGENPGQEFREKLQNSQQDMDRQMAPYIELAKADGLAAVAWVRAHAAQYGVQPDRVGIIGFSAGGTLAAAAALNYTSDSDRPDFAAPIYGALHVLDLQKIPENPMPVFMAVSGDDFFGFQNQSMKLFQ
ncbi:MAG TPA: alpha/beta hydrolase, partial [Robiginitalea sp.]|nr:alpha/beta hydrolase [Robiginitalea sp.]